MSSSPPTASLAGLIEELSAIEAKSSQQEYIVEHSQFWERKVVLGIADAVVKMAREDIVRAERLADAATWLSEVLKDDFCRARSARSSGNVQVLQGKNKEALLTYQKSYELFRQLSEEVEAAITLSSSLQPLIYLGSYGEAYERAQKARTVFELHHDTLRLARLDVNVGNILHRQDRFKEALVSYERALGHLEELGQHRDCAIVWANMAVCHISLNDFMHAQDAYLKARLISERENMPNLVAQADYNIAYLYFLRGEHMHAIQLYQETREYCDRVGDKYHTALCDLDQSEMYLELNLIQEASRLAQQAFSGFEDLGMEYEAAKALVFLGISAYQEHKVFRALELLGKAQDRMRQEQNNVWVAVLDLYQALVLHHEGRTYEARRASKRAKEFFSSQAASGKSILTDLLEAVLLLEVGDAAAALACCQSALRAAKKINSPALLSQAYWVLGGIQESTKDDQNAYTSYSEALAEWEVIPNRRNAEELKIPFIRNDLALYEGLVSLGATFNQSLAQREAIFEVIEKAKSRELAGMLAFRAHSLPAPSGTHSGLVEQVKNLREELNWYYRQVDLAEFRNTESAAGQAQGLRQAIREREEVLLRMLVEMRGTDEEFYAVQIASITPIGEIQNLLRTDEILLEYFHARGLYYVCLLNRDRLEVIPLTRTEMVRDLIRSLDAQFSKMQSGATNIHKSGADLLEGALATLRDLNTELVEPIDDHLKGKRLIVVPDGPLHYVPFHALFDGSRFLTDKHVISYAGSASLYFLSSMKKASSHGPDLILEPKVSDESMSRDASLQFIQFLPDATIFRGAKANAKALESNAAGNRFIHLVAELNVRQDNPILSTISLGDSPKTILDLFHLRFPCQVMGLTGTGPGLRATGNGEEIHVLARGLEYAGARALLMPLWNTNREPLGIFLNGFYRRAASETDKAKAMQAAMAEVRAVHAHPFEWASFILRGYSERAE
jgi:CHAT domain-containing protein/tetratricopeptide (TPR) repeat protein